MWQWLVQHHIPGLVAIFVGIIIPIVVFWYATMRHFRMQAERRTQVDRRKIDRRKESA